MDAPLLPQIADCIVVGNFLQFDVKKTRCKQTKWPCSPKAGIAGPRSGGDDEGAGDGDVFAVIMLEGP